MEYITEYYLFMLIFHTVGSYWRGCDWDMIFSVLAKPQVTVASMPQQSVEISNVKGRKLLKQRVLKESFALKLLFRQSCSMESKLCLSNNNDTSWQVLRCLLAAVHPVNFWRPTPLKPHTTEGALNIHQSHNHHGLVMSGSYVKRD